MPILQRRPIVYIIGAGPGDPGLITVRGLQCLAAADVVLYDRLVSPRLLRHAPPFAERIDVGGAAPGEMAQEAICYLIAEKAREGRVVARLKWGDPFVFDRGGEEALFLHEQGIPFEVVPGVPAAIGVPSYAGVPLTYTGGGDTVTLVRGHEDESQTAPQVDWASLAKLKGTVVCYAGSRQLGAVLDALLSHGRAKSETAVVIVNGTLPSQRTIEGSLEELAARAKESPIGSPSILVVGRVAGLREHLRWFDERPLFGRRVVVTRPREDAAELVDRLVALGAEAIEAPMTRILPPEDFGPLDDAVAQTASFDWIVFTSANAVESYMGRLLAGAGDVRDLKGVRLCAIGPVTRDRLQRYYVKVDLVPAEGHPEGVVSALEAQGPIRGARFLLPRADSGREVLADVLRRSGAEVTDVTAYRLMLSEAQREGEPDIYRMLLERRDRRRHLHERVHGAELRDARSAQRAGAGPAAADDGRVHRAGDGRSRRPARNPDDHRAAGIHGRGAGGRDREALRARARSPTRGPWSADRADLIRSFRDFRTPKSAFPAPASRRIRAAPWRVYRTLGGVSRRTRSTVPGGRSTSLPSVAATTPPPPIRMPAMRALEAAEDAADDRADARAGADLADLTLDALALDRLGDGAADRVAAPVHGELVEAHGEAALPVDAAGRRHRAHDAAQLGAGGNHHALAHLQVDQGRRQEAVLDLVAARVERILQADVELLADRDQRCRSSGGCSVPCWCGTRRARARRSRVAAPGRAAAAAAAPEAGA